MTTKAVSPLAVIFDLDGVLTDTAELHFRSWRVVADELGIPFDRAVNDRMRGLSRPESLAVLLGDRHREFSPERKRQLTDRKNEAYLELVAQMTEADLLPGAKTLIEDLQRRGVRMAIASSSRNAEVVVERLGIRAALHTLVDANTAPRSKPDPQVFVAAAVRLGVSPARCVVLEDAEAGVAAALAAGMPVIGIGPRERVGGADLVVAHLAELDADRVLSVVED